MATHEFDRLIREIHDHVYGTSAIKTPEALQAEVAKAVMVLVAESQGLVDPRPVFLGDEGAWVRQAYNSVVATRPEWDWGSIELDDDSLSFIVRKLEVVDFHETERDFLGDALEVMRSTDAKRLGGQFFTDQRVTELALDLLDYDPSSHDFADVCAGTGGFLIPAAKRARAHKEAKPIVGIEIDAKISRLANATLRHLVDDETATVFNADSLADSSTWATDVKRGVIPGTHARLASNPPFGSKIKLRDRALLDRFELARRWVRVDSGWRMRQDSTARPPEILFIERNVQFAEPGSGKIALVLPYQILSGPQLGYVRHWILTNTRVCAIVDLPADTFQPWTGTKTSVVVLERRAKPLTSLDEVEDTPIFMALPEDIGHDRRGNPVRWPDGSIREDLSLIRQAYSAFTEGNEPSQITDRAFVVSSHSLVGDPELRLNAAFYRPQAQALISALSNLSSTSLEVKRLGDLVSSVFCPGRFKRDYVKEAGVPFLGGTNISQFSLTTDKYLSSDDPHLPELVVQPGWILVTRSGSTGIVSRVPNAWSGFAMSEHVIRIVPLEDSDSVADYLEAFLRSSWGQRLLASGVFGSVIDEITPDFITELPVPVPKKKADLSRIARQIRSANEARDVTASGLVGAASELEHLLGSSLT
jgi:predicted RNA methylase